MALLTLRKTAHIIDVKVKVGVPGKRLFNAAENNLASTPADQTLIMEMGNDPANIFVDYELDCLDKLICKGCGSYGWDSDCHLRAACAVDNPPKCSKT